MDSLESIKDFVRCHLNDDVEALRLKYANKHLTKHENGIEFALIQIEARKKTRKKIPSYIENESFLFPSILSAEQASNENVARFHASLLANDSSVLDITAGLGIDDFEFCKRGMKVTSCEIDSLKCDILRHNADILNLSDKLTIHNCNSIDFIRSCSKKFDIVFADPARRNGSGGRLHALADCQPDITDIMSEILSISSRIVIKSSPLLDISMIRNTIDNLTHLYIVCVKGECKEVLIDIQKDSTFNGITVVDLDQNGELSRFHIKSIDSERLSESFFCNRKSASEYKYLYEPNAGIMKTGAWTYLIKRYPDLRKTDINTHIFLSDTIYSDFPGRVMVIKKEPDKREIKTMKGSKINIVSRNHPLSAPQISKKYGITPGSDTFLYAFRYCGLPSFLITQPMI